MPQQEANVVQKIVAPLAFTPRAGAIAREADRLARACEAELLLLHVGRPDEAQRTTLTEQLAHAGLTGAQIVFRGGEAARIICRVAAESHADLIVLGALEQEGPLGYYIGSVARRVARRAHCSVLLLAEPQAQPAAPRRWVVTAEFSSAGLDTLRFALDLARVEKPEVVEVASEYALPGFSMAMERHGDERGADDLRRQLHREEQTRLAEFIAGVDTHEVNVRPVCLRGREGWESAEYARRQSADLLIVSAPGRLTFWDKLFQHGVEFALESMPCRAVWLHRQRRDT